MKKARFISNGLKIGLGIGLGLALTTFLLNQTSFKLPFYLRFPLVALHFFVNGFPLLLDMRLRSDFGKITPSSYLATILVPAIYGAISYSLLNKTKSVILQRFVLIMLLGIYLVANIFSFLIFLAYGFST